MPTSPGDVLALRRHAQHQGQTLEDYLAFLEAQEPMDEAELRRRTFGPSPPFTLDPTERDPL